MTLLEELSALADDMDSEGKPSGCVRTLIGIANDANDYSPFEVLREIARLDESGKSPFGQKPTPEAAELITVARTVVAKMRRGDERRRLPVRRHVIPQNLARETEAAATLAVDRLYARRVYGRKDTTMTPEPLLTPNESLTLKVAAANGNRRRDRLTGRAPAA